MPIFENICPSETCENHSRILEWYAPRFSTPDPDCSLCGVKTVRIPSSFAVPLCGVIVASKYSDPKSEAYHQDGHLVYRRNSSKSGAPEPVWIETFQDQKEYCKEEGLMNPSELSSGAQISADGRKFQTAGMPGQWV